MVIEQILASPFSFLCAYFDPKFMFSQNRSTKKHDQRKNGPKKQSKQKSSIFAGADTLSVTSRQTGTNTLLEISTSFFYIHFWRNTKNV